MRRWGMACIIALALPAGGFLLLMGASNLIHPLVPEAYLARNTAICLAVCAAGAVSWLAAAASAWDLVRRGKRVGAVERS